VDWKVPDSELLGCSLTDCVHQAHPAVIK